MKSETTTSKPGPDWERLYETAAAQEGYFSTAQAREAGYSPQLLARHLGNGRMSRMRRGVYRLTHFPAGEHEEFVVVWLWSERVGIFSHETALFLHGLSDALPARVHLTLPAAWRGRRLRTPKDVALHYSDVGESDRGWVGPVPVTKVSRTIMDCAEDGVAPDLVRDAFEQASDRGLIRRDSLPEVVAYLTRFFSVSRSSSGPRFRSSSRSRKTARTS